MPSEAIQKLLLLQEKDRVRLDLEARLESIPREIATNREKILREEERAREARETVAALETRRNTMEGDLEALNAKIVKYRNQQLEVKKNEEYQALEHEIETVQSAISDLEDEEIQVLVDIDTARAGQEEAEKACREGIGVLEQRIAKLEARDKESREELVAAREQVESARAAVPAEFLEVYDRLLRHVRFPAVVPLRDKKCQGCHLKVSAGAESAARGGKEIATCDSCGRLLYFE